MNLPNKLTLFRMALVPLIILVMIGDLFCQTQLKILGSQVLLDYFICAILFCIASYTDYLDGQIARKNHLITTFGKFMDPIADKLLVNSVLILLAYDNKIPVLCVILMTGRDLIVDAIRLMAAQNQKVIAAGPLGKLKTVCQMLAIPLVMVDNFPFGWLPFDLGFVMIIIATFVSLISGYDYFMKNKDMVFESM